MTKSIGFLKPSEFRLTIRFVQGYRYLDRCGEALVKLERSLDEGWLPQSPPAGGVMCNHALGMVAEFNAESLTIVQSGFLSFEHFQDQSCKIYEVLWRTCEIDHILSPSARVTYQRGCQEIETAHQFLHDTGLFPVQEDLLTRLGGTKTALQYVLCTEGEIQLPTDDRVTARSRFEAKVITKETQLPFDKRLLVRCSLLSKNSQEAMKQLRKVRSMHEPQGNAAAVIDLERTYEGEFSSGLFDVPGFLRTSHFWAETVRKFVEDSYDRS